MKDHILYKRNSIDCTHYIFSFRLDINICWQRKTFKFLNGGQIDSCLPAAGTSLSFGPFVKKMLILSACLSKSLIHHSIQFSYSTDSVICHPLP